MDFAYLDVCYLRSWPRWRKSSCHDRDHFKAVIGKDLARPSPNAAADKNKARKADSCACHQARKAKRDPEGENDRPRGASRHLDGLSRALFLIPNNHHDFTVR